MKTIGIDIGTTTVCGVLIDSEDGNLLEVNTLKNDSSLSSDYEWERKQNPERIVQLCNSILESYIQEHDDIESIGVTGAMHGIVYIGKDGKAVSPLYTWQDQRGNQINSKTGKSYVEELTEIAGYDMATGFGLATHYYNLKNDMVPDQAVSFCTIPDYVATSFTKEKELLMHQSMAASFGLYDIKKSKFDIDQAKKAGMEESYFPKVTQENKICGNTKEGIPVSVALGDNQASFLGSVNKECKVLLNVGTGSQLSVYSKKIIEAKGIECRPYLNDSWILAGSALCGGYAYSLMKKFFEDVLSISGVSAKRAIYDIMNEAAEAAYHEQPQLTVDTRFNGTRYDKSITGNVMGLKESTFTPGHLAPLIAFEY